MACLLWLSLSPCTSGSEAHVISGWCVVPLQVDVVFSKSEQPGLFLVCFVQCMLHVSKGVVFRILVSSSFNFHLFHQYVIYFKKYIKCTPGKTFLKWISSCAAFPSGAIEHRSRPYTPVKHFTQADVNNGKIIYRPPQAPSHLQELYQYSFIGKIHTLIFISCLRIFFSRTSQMCL